MVPLTPKYSTPSTPNASRSSRCLVHVDGVCAPVTMCHLLQIKWGAKSEYEYTLNYSLVQKAMKKLKIDKVIPAEALMKARAHS